MSVRWPDGSLTGSVRAGKPAAPAPVEAAPVTIEPAEKSDDKKEASNGSR